MNTTKIKESFTLPKLQKAWATLFTFVLTMGPSMAQVGDAPLQWNSAMSSGNPVSAWLRIVMLAVMACFILVSVILGSLAFKQLAADGNWKDFWSKIAGAVGMFVVPIAIYYFVGNSSTAAVQGGGAPPVGP